MRTRREKARAGFTLIELMMVVAILGILAMFAIPRYKSYLYRSKVAEGIAFLSEIKSRQESYRADFGQYCAVMSGQSSTDYYPTTQNSGKQYTWETAPTTGYGAGYRQLGAYPPSQTTLFQYQVLAGPPGAGNVPTNVPGFTGDDFWFVSRARADLDSNGTFMLLEGYSASSNIYNDSPNGYN